MSDELWRISAVEAVTRLRNGEISPLELVEASARRIAEIEPAVNALPTLCLRRARSCQAHHAGRRRLRSRRRSGMARRPAGLHQGPDRCGGGAPHLPRPDPSDVVARFLGG